MTEDKIKILLLEDDEALAMGIIYSLREEGYEVEHLSTYEEGKRWLDIYTGTTADALVQRHTQILALFDIMLPDGNGFDLLQQFRSRHVNIPVIFLTAVSDEVNVVQGLELGADDYIAKPFRVREFLSRIKAVLRRYRMDEAEGENDNMKDGSAEESYTSDGMLWYRDIMIDTHMARVAKQTGIAETVQVVLSPGEYRLLLYFVYNQGVILERSTILERLFDGSGSYVDDNTLYVYIKRLREKIGDTDKANPYIRTVRGIGYMMEREDAVK